MSEPPFFYNNMEITATPRKQTEFISIDPRGSAETVTADVS